MFALALGLRLHDIGVEPLWYDELLTGKRAAMTVPDLVSDSAANLHTPVYFLLAKAMVMLLDGSVDVIETALRLPSALAGALTALLACLLARRIAPASLRGQWAGLAAGLLVACQPFQVLYGQEARSYTLVSAFVMMGLWGGALIAAHGNKASRSAWVAWAVGTGGAVATVLGAIFFVIPAVASLIIALRRSRGQPEQRALRLKTIIAVSSAILIAGAGLCVLALPMGRVSGVGGWVPPPSWTMIREAVASVYLFAVSEPIMFTIRSETPLLLALLVIAAAGFGVREVSRHRDLAWPLFLAVGLLPVMLLVVSIWRPVFLPRYLFWSAPPFLVLVGIGFASVPWRRPLLIPGVPLLTSSLALLALCLWSVNTYQATEKRPRWDEAFVWLKANTAPGDIVYVEDWMIRDVLMAQMKRYLGDASAMIVTDQLDDAVRQMQAGHKVWLVSGAVHYGQRDTGIDHLRDVASDLGAHPEGLVQIGQTIGIAAAIADPAISSQPDRPLPAQGD